MGSRQKSTVDSESDSSQARFLKMEAIKKKMQAMKVEKDNACDQADVSEEKMKAARIRAQKGEDEVEELLIKSRQLETELDMTAERLGIATLQLEEKQLATIKSFTTAFPFHRTFAVPSTLIFAIFFSVFLANFAFSIFTIKSSIFPIRSFPTVFPPC